MVPKNKILNKNSKFFYIEVDRHDGVALDSYIDAICILYEGRGQKYSSFIFDVRLIIEEIVTNIFMHGYKENFDDANKVCIMTEVEDEIIHIRIRDGAPFFDITKHFFDRDYEKIDLIDIPIGGLGIALVQQKSYSIKHAYKSNQNVTSIVKKLHA